MKFQITLIMIVPVISMMAGCAADQEAQQLASTLHRYTAEYQAALHAKLDAEETFYRSQANNIGYLYDGRVLEPYSAVEKNGQNVVTFDATKTVAYGRIVTASTADSDRLAEQLSKMDDPTAYGAIADFISAGIQSDRQAFLDATGRAAHVRTDLLNSLAKLDGENAKLKKLSQDLSELEKNSTPSQRLQDLAAIGKAIADQLKNTSSTSASGH